jgi:hypothetical protein
MKHIFAASIPKLVGVILIGLYSGCSVLDPAEDIPSYLHIDSITLSVQPDEGSSSAKISDAWVFMDGQLLGGFELPCNIPILAEGTHSFIIRGGVKMNGLSSTRAIYPGWKGWEGSVNLVRGQKTTVAPVVTYFPGIDFLGTWMLDFDQQGTSLIPEPTTSAVVRIDSLYNLYENNCGYIHLNNTDTTFFVGTSPPGGYLMPATYDTWVEFDYWSDCEFNVGIMEESSAAPSVLAVTLLPKHAWTKIYVRLTDALASALAQISNPGQHPYRIYIAFQNPSSQSESHLYIDNIKLLK